MYYCTVLIKTAKQSFAHEVMPTDNSCQSLQPHKAQNSSRNETHSQYFSIMMTNSRDIGVQQGNMVVK